jgi:hypothetical protein
MRQRSFNRKSYTLAVFLKTEKPACERAFSAFGFTNDVVQVGEKVLAVHLNQSLQHYQR